MKIFVGLISFAAGVFVALILSFLITAHRGACTSPCDGPSYAAIGLFLLFAPVLSTVFAVLGYLGFSRYKARRSPSGA
jgi:hypothetical protein